MNKYIFLLLLASSTAVLGQDFEKSPKRITLETGYTHIRKTSFPNLSQSGFVFAFDYGWRVSGFKHKPGAYISMPVGYIAIPPMKEGTKNGGIAYYGIHIIHELSKDKTVIPFIGYSLLFNQLRIQETAGRVIGHETRFDAGANFGSRLFAKAEYSIGTFPALGKEKADKLGTWGLKVGYKIR